MGNWNIASVRPELHATTAGASKATPENWLEDHRWKDNPGQHGDPDLIGFACDPAMHDRPSSQLETASLMRKIYGLRRLRETLFPSGLFADPTWDILIDLYASFLEHRSIGVSSACIAAHAPSTTALRHIKNMVNLGIIARRPDPYDNRRVYLELTPAARAAMAKWAEAAGDSLPSHRLRA